MTVNAKGYNWVVGESELETILGIARCEGEEWDREQRTGNGLRCRGEVEADRER